MSPDVASKLKQLRIRQNEVKAVVVEGVDLTIERRPRTGGGAGRDENRGGNSNGNSRGGYRGNREGGAGAGAGRGGERRFDRNKGGDHRGSHRGERAPGASRAPRTPRNED